MEKTVKAWALSLGFFSRGTPSESLKKENSFFAVGAISKTLKSKTSQILERNQLFPR